MPIEIKRRPTPKGIGGVSDEDFLAAFSVLMHRADLLHGAHARGMFVATTAEQQEYLDYVNTELSR